jgi:membrane fusion protein (multidrug efflux system)
VNDQGSGNAKRTGALKILGWVIGILLIGFIIYYFVGRAPAENSSSRESPPPEVAVVTLEPEHVTLTTELPGRTTAHLVAEVRPQVGGLIQKRVFTEGSEVEAGEVLYEIDSAPFQAALDSALANLEGARKSVKQAQAALETSIAAVEQQRAVLELALVNRRRLEALAQDGAASLYDRDRAVTEAEVAEATLRSAEARVNSSQQAVEVATAAIAQAEAAVQTAQINLDYTRIKAPISGYIGRSNVTVGALVTAHQPLALATINQLDPIYVDVPQSTTELLRLERSLEDKQLEKEGSDVNKVRLILEDGTPYPQEGTLQFRDVSVDESTGSVILRMVFPNPEKILLPGMFVRASITEGVNPNAILIPQQAVSRDTRGDPLALVVDDSDTVSQRKLTLGRTIGNRWIVLEGLKAGERIIVEGEQRARPGSVVKPVPFNAAQSDSSTSNSASQPQPAGGEGGD